jgi:aldehyde:ferredoxin oxidoreductase
MTAGESRQLHPMRIICAPRGFKREDGFDISPRLFEPHESGTAKGKSIAAFLPEMVDEYYREMGWEAETGIPTRPMLARLYLEDYAASIERRGSATCRTY